MRGDARFLAGIWKIVLVKEPALVILEVLAISRGLLSLARDSSGVPSTREVILGPVRMLKVADVRWLNNRPC